MNKNLILLGDTVLKNSKAPIEGGFVTIEGERFYRISNFNEMPDFFMTIVSDSDHWMFISSNGSLSAGRKNRENSLFPYYTDDKIHDYCGLTGSKTYVIAEKNGKNYLWEPFSRELSKVYSIERNLYKSIYGNKIIFEENNLDLELSFRYGWYNSEKFGFVKKASLTNKSNKEAKLEVLDGIKNILPSGVGYNFQNEYSNLLDGYKKSELINQTGLGLFMLSSIPVDKAEPSESLNATTVWSYGLPQCKILLSNKQTDSFCKGLPIVSETDVRASRGAFYVSAELNLASHQSQEWLIVAEINQSTADVANLNALLTQKSILVKEISNDIKAGTSNLVKIVATADGLQCTQEELTSARHFSNTLYNVMRGGVYLNNYWISRADFLKFTSNTNKLVTARFVDQINSLPEEVSYHELMQIAEKSGDTDFMRICYEYLPLTFSRRHGDPSRPWNAFSIDTKNADGSPKSDYQGNWRDIFQNWEALSLSYPEFVENIISKFVNASTPDGYNPYRIMRNGIDWECPDPHDPWAYIGYWGDHQIIYLQKLLELSNNYHPGKLDSMLEQNVFAYANVPYRIKPYTEIVKNPQDTIEFNVTLNDKIKKLVIDMGADGRLLLHENKQVYYVNLTEKILVTLLAKLSNFVPEAGIWLNTQRPEWNDANNALVGNGVSMVTLYYMRRFLQFWKDKFSQTSLDSVTISEEVKELFDSIFKLFSEHTGILQTGFSDEQRRYFTDVLGEAGSKYRNRIYANAFSGKKVTISAIEMVQFCEIALQYIDQSVRANKRSDGLYHSYNLISFKEKTVSIRYLYEMLEGQVAVLSAGSLTPREGLEVFNSLKNSKLFREDQYSYILYPDRQLPLFVEKNNIPAERVKKSKLLSQLITDKDTSILHVDNAGNYHFSGAFRNAGYLKAALENLNQQKYAVLLKDEKDMVLAIYEEMFDHQSFTGRSGTFYAYEGLGSIYWHMVSKLLLAAEEYFFKAIDEAADTDMLGKLKNYYYEIKAGIGLYKSPELYGAFPTDAYSHTPGNAGVKQPGMTGQVKEDVISRMGELGIRIIQGEIIFNTRLLNSDEFLQHEKLFEYISLSGEEKQINLNKNQLGFTICQVPCVYTRSDKNEITVRLSKGGNMVFEGHKINQQVSYSIFNRTGEVEAIEVLTA